MNIAIGADHRGYKLKNSLKTWLHLQGHQLVDVGTDDPGSTDYTDYALEVGRLVAKGEAELGILICGTGIGMSIAANKVEGVRAARVCTEQDAEIARRHNNANVLCFGADSGVDEVLAQKMITAWIETGFEGGRHERRIGKITAFERGGKG
jgi:ribose 5-phosphate isomerase B